MADTPYPTVFDCIRLYATVFNCMRRYPGTHAVSARRSASVRLRTMAGARQWIRRAAQTAGQRCQSKPCQTVKVRRYSTKVIVLFKAVSLSQEEGRVRLRLFRESASEESV